MFQQTSGASCREHADLCLKLECRHCEERSEAIHPFFPLRRGLFRFARNDGREEAAPIPAFCNGELPISQPLLDAGGEAEHSVRCCALRTIVRKTGR
jgi:hypothetical protein